MENIYGDTQTGGRVSAAAALPRFSDKAADEILGYIIRIYLRLFGVRENVIGFKCMQLAVTLFVKDPVYETNVTKILYPEVARRVLRSSENVEIKLHRLIVTAWTRGNRDLFGKVFGRSRGGGIRRPGAHEFIATVAEMARLSLRRINLGKAAPFEKDEWLISLG